MKEKIVYNYDAESKVFIGSEVCNQDPLDGEYLIPANCSETAPEVIDGYVPVLEDGVWVNKENNIGKFRVVNNEIAQIKELGSFDFVLTKAQLNEINSGKLVKIENNEIVIYEKEKTIEEQILMLEAQITPRRIREAILGDKDSVEFIQDIEKQIEKLREVI